MKKRIDLLLIEKGLTQSRHRAQGLILSGNVLVNDVPVTKAGTLVAEDSAIRIRGGGEHPYVSRGGVKLARALEVFQIVVDGRIAMDVGASTGGFTQVLLLQGAQRVFAFDVGHNQMDWKIRSDPRVTVIEKTNAREMVFQVIGQKVDCIVIDVSFISLEKILPNLLQFAAEGCDWVTLIKPQFEVGRERVGKGGIVTSEEDRQEVVVKLRSFCESLGLRCLGLVESPITGTDGNKEFLAHWKI